jgi:8-oxo-dGTP diphosphatase
VQPAPVPDALPRIPAAAGALIFDRKGRLLILKPNYKRGWTIPGGQIDEGGESPWQACRREVREETGLAIERGRLVCVDFRGPRPGRPGGVRFLFDCGMLSGRQRERIELQTAEIDRYRFAPIDEALARLSGPVRRRVAAAIPARRCLYLEEGRLLEGVHG